MEEYNLFELRKGPSTPVTVPLCLHPTGFTRNVRDPQLMRALTRDPQLMRILTRDPQLMRALKRDAQLMKSITGLLEERR